MMRSFFSVLVCGAFFTAASAVAFADDAKEEAIKKDRKQIEGIWRASSLVVDGNKSETKDAKKLSVVNSPDGVWTFVADGKELYKGKSSIDPTKKIKTIDFSLTDADGKSVHYLGIYELGEKTRKLCFALASKGRPTEFASKPGSESIFATFERETDK
ncbi:hypothetical protein BH11PLA2_BH11PLA2_43160 [soil metagenome]